MRAALFVTVGLGLFASPVFAQSSMMEQDTYRNGAVYKVTQGGYAHTCAAACEADEACYSWTYMNGTNSYQPWCELKQAVGIAEKRPGATAGVSPRFAPSTDIWGKTTWQPKANYSTRVSAPVRVQPIDTLSGAPLTTPNITYSRPVISAPRPAPTPIATPVRRPEPVQTRPAPTPAPAAPEVNPAPKPALVSAPPAQQRSMVTITPPAQPQQAATPPVGAPRIVIAPSTSLPVITIEPDPAPVAVSKPAPVAVAAPKPAAQSPVKVDVQPAPEYYPDRASAEAAASADYYPNRAKPASPATDGGSADYYPDRPKTVTPMPDLPPDRIIGDVRISPDPRSPYYGGHTRTASYSVAKPVAPMEADQPVTGLLRGAYN